MNDPLYNIRQLPRGILQQLDRLIVNRTGESQSATMQTLDIVGFISPQKTYQLVHSTNTDAQTLEIHLEEVKPDCEIILNHYQGQFAPPPHACFEGSWKNQDSNMQTNANILGGMGSLLLSHDIEKPIPILRATQNALAFYHAKLLSVNDTITFDTHKDLPITAVSIGEQYVDNFLSHPNFGGGEYLEYHNEPHLWMPRQPQCKGHILLGREIEGKFYLTGFSIPYGSAIYLSPYALHSDAYLIGDYCVIYTIASDYSTVIFKNQDNSLKRLSFFVPCEGP